MKERRTSGATHSFRLTPEACHLIETHRDVLPRRLGGMSRTTSDAIVWYLSEREGHRLHQAGAPVEILRELEDCRAARAYWMKKAQSDPQVPGWWRRILNRIVQVLT